MLPTDNREFEEKLKVVRREEEEREAERRAEKFKLAYLDLRKAPIQLDALGKVGEEEAKKFKAAAFHFKGRELALAVFDPEAAKELIEKLAAPGLKLKLFVSSLSGLNHVWSFYEYLKEMGGEITGSVTIDRDRFEKLRQTLLGLENVKKSVGDFKSSKTSEILEIILAGALANRASDLHFEPRKGAVVLRLRVDGSLHDVLELGEANYRTVLSRVKLLSGLKINVKDQAQDGRFSIAVGSGEVEIRTSILPSEFGETIVMRVLDPREIELELSELGLRKDDLAIIEAELKRPNGMTLNTGPTGSGKTTTLYAFLKKIYSSETKTITIEDPIEYRLEGIEQTQVDPEAGYTFASGLRSILRQDPDVILIGEIRDLETAEIAMHAALTGHLVFSTLHTNDAAGAIPRLIDLGVRPSVIAPAVNLIIAQRLVRRLCESCRTPEKTDAALAEKIGRFLKKLPPRVDRAGYREMKIYKAVGCQNCGGFGYRGRIAIYELLPAGEKMEEAIIKEPTQAKIEELAAVEGMVSMQEDGVLKAINGITTFEEVEKLTGPIAWK